MNIKWSIDHEYDINQYLLVGDLNKNRFVEVVRDKFWGLPLLYKKWLIKRKFRILNK